MKNIIVAIDFGSTTKQLIETVKEFAQKIECKVHIVHTEEPVLDIPTTSCHYYFQIINPTEDIYPEEREKRIEEGKTIAKSRLTEIQDYMEQSGIETTTALLCGNIAETILEEAEKIDAYRIFVGANDHGPIYQLFFGSTRENIILNAKCPVVVIPPGYCK